MLKSDMKKRFYIIFMIFILIFTILILRIINFSYFSSKDLKAMAQDQYQYQERVSELNYLLLDTKGRNLLNYNNQYYAVIDAQSFLTNNNYAKKDELDALKIVLKNYNEDYNIEAEISKNKNMKIRWLIDENAYNKLQQIKGVNGFYVYKYSTVNRDNGWWSIENLITNPKKNQSNILVDKAEDSIEMKIANKTKHNEHVYKVFDKNVNGDITSEFLTKPKNNLNVRLTLDKNIQQSIKNILNTKPFNKFEQVGVVLMEADSGKIRALVQKDDSKPNVNLGVSTQNGFFAGSIFKLVVEEAGIETNTLALSKKYEHKNFGGLFEEHEDRKSKNAREALVKSSNNVFVQIGRDVGIKSVNAFSEKQGLYEKALGFDEEQKGNLELNINTSADNSGDSLQAYIGQKTRITPIEAISIPNTIINKGIYVKPYIIEGYVDSENNLLEKGSTDKKRVLSETTSNVLKNQMIAVVNSKDGTGKGTYINDIEIGGKTGTSARVEGQGEIKEYYDGWFAGFFKVNDKYYSMIVFVQNIGKDINASGSAVPIFKKIIEENYNYLKKF